MDEKRDDCMRRRRERKRDREGGGREGGGRDRAKQISRSGRETKQLSIACRETLLCLYFFNT